MDSSVQIVLLVVLVISLFAWALDTPHQETEELMGKKRRKMPPHFMPSTTVILCDTCTERSNHKCDHNHMAFPRATACSFYKGKETATILLPPPSRPKQQPPAAQSGFVPNPGKEDARLRIYQSHFEDQFHEVTEKKEDNE
jgi:hypothetical protein